MAWLPSTKPIFRRQKRRSPIWDRPGFFKGVSTAPRRCLNAVLCSRGSSPLGTDDQALCGFQNDVVLCIATIRAVPSRHAWPEYAKRSFAEERLLDTAQVSVEPLRRTLLFDLDKLERPRALVTAL